MQRTYIKKHKTFFFLWGKKIKNQGSKHQLNCWSNVKYVVKGENIHFRKKRGITCLCSCSTSILTFIKIYMENSRLWFVYMDNIDYSDCLVWDLELSIFNFFALCLYLDTKVLEYNTDMMMIIRNCFLFPTWLVLLLQTVTLGDIKPAPALWHEDTGRKPWENGR